MKNVALNKLKNRTRWLLFAGVLSGLFFSGGEGIRLFPFPFTSGKDASGKQFSVKKTGVYNFSVRSFGGGNRADFVGKFQKNIKRQPFAPAVAYSQLDLVERFSVTPIESTEPSALTVSYRAVITASDRAPPVA